MMQFIIMKGETYITEKTLELVTKNVVTSENYYEKLSKAKK